MCKVTPVILHGVVSPDKGSLDDQRSFFLPTRVDSYPLYVHGLHGVPRSRANTPLELDTFLSPIQHADYLALPHSGWQTILKLTRWVCGTSSTTSDHMPALLARSGSPTRCLAWARAVSPLSKSPGPPSGAPKSTKTELVLEGGGVAEEPSGA